MKPITIAEALEQNPMVCKTWEEEQARIKQEKIDFAITEINKIIARNIHHLNDGEYVMERVIGSDYWTLKEAGSLYTEFSVGPMSASDTIFIKKK